MTTETLTPAELEMIKIKREQDALALKKAAAEKALQLEKDIELKKQHIAQIVKASDAQVAAAKELQAELGPLYVVEIDAKTNESVVMDKEEVFWSEKYLKQTAVIKRGAYKIHVREYKTYSSKWDNRGTFKGYRMYVSGPGLDYKQETRSYTRTSKVNEIILDAIKEIERIEYIETCKKSALSTVVKQMQKTYPGATVKVDYEYTKSYGKSTIGTKYDTVQITFLNGASSKYRVYPDGSLSTISIMLPGKDAYANMEQLNQMNFNLINQ